MKRYNPQIIVVVRVVAGTAALIGRDGVMDMVGGWSKPWKLNAANKVMAKINPKINI